MQDVDVETLDFDKNQILFNETKLINYDTISRIKPLLKTETDIVVLCTISQGEQNYMSTVVQYCMQVKETVQE